MSAVPERILGETINSDMCAPYDTVLHSVSGQSHKSVARSMASAPGLVLNLDAMIEFPRPYTHDMLSLDDLLYTNDNGGIS